MPTVTIQTSVSGDKTGTYSKLFSLTAGGRISMAEPIVDGSTDLEVALDLDVSQVKFFAMRADQDMTVKTNASGAADNTFALTAGETYLFPRAEGESWQDTSDAAVSANITALFVTNASGQDGTLNLDAIYDPTV